MARFEDWDSKGRRFDLVISGEAWHWIDPDIGHAKAADVLMPGGALAVFWNRPSFEDHVAERSTSIDPPEGNPRTNMSWSSPHPRSR